MVNIKSKTRFLNVLMNGISIGILEKQRDSGLQFSYNENWLNLPGARPISLSLPLMKKKFMGDIVYNFFDNLLPDNPQVRSRIQAKFQIQTSHPFDLLAIIGKDCIGAIQLIEGEIPEFKKEIEYSPLTEKEIASLLSHYQENPLGMLDENETFRISLAGVQEKAAFLYHENTWNRPLGTTPTSHIFKLPIGVIQHQSLDLSDSCENEWLCSQISEAFGLPTAPCEILHFEQVKVLSVKRFDRQLSNDKKWWVRLPQEDMCQALGFSPNLKYQADGGPGIDDIMRLLLGSTETIQDRALFFRSQILFWLLGAIDGHAKNFSLFIDPYSKYRLTPLYDILSAYPLIAKKKLQAQKIKMAMALKGKNNHYHWHTLKRRHFIETAKRVNYSTDQAEKNLDEMLSKVELVIDQVSKQLPADFPEAIANSIFEGMLTAKLKLQT